MRRGWGYEGFVGREGYGFYGGSRRIGVAGFFRLFRVFSRLFLVRGVVALRGFVGIWFL